MAKKKTLSSVSNKNATANTSTDMVSGSKAMAFRKINYILLLVSVVSIVAGFLLMVGGSSTTEAYNPDIFSVRRTNVAPMVCLFGFLLMIVAILYHKKDGKAIQASDNESEK